MEDDRTRRTLDTLADLYLTGPVESARPQPSAPADAQQALDGPAPLRLRPNHLASPPRVGPGGKQGAGAGRRWSTDLQWAPRTARLRRDARIPARVEAVFLGNLPGFGGPWLTQYAHHLSQEIGPVVVLHVDDEQVDLELVASSAYRAELDELGRAGNVPAAEGAMAALAALTRDDLPRIGAWLVHLPMPLTAVSRSLAADFDRWTLISGSDQTAAVGAYRWLKELIIGEDEGRPSRRVGLMVMGSEPGKAEVMARNLAQTAGNFLDVPVELLGSQKQMVSVHLKMLGSFAGGIELWPQVAAFLADRGQLDDQPEAATPVLQLTRDEASPAAPALEPLQTSEFARAGIPGGSASTPPPESPDIPHLSDLPDSCDPEPALSSEDTHVFDSAAVLADVPEVEQDDSSSDELLRQLLAHELASTPSPAAPMKDKPPAATSASAEQPPPREPTNSVKRFIEHLARVKEAEAAAATSEESVTSQVAGHPPAALEAATSAAPHPEAQVIAPTKGDDPSASIPTDAETNLARFLPGAIALEARSPYHEQVQLAVSEDGQLHLLLEHRSSPERIADALLQLFETRQWVQRHIKLLQLTQRQVRINIQPSAQIHLFTPYARAAGSHMSHADQNLHLHLLQRVTVANQSTWFSTALS